MILPGRLPSRRSRFSAAAGGGEPGSVRASARPDRDARAGGDVPQGRVHEEARVVRAREFPLRVPVHRRLVLAPQRELLRDERRPRHFHRERSARRGGSRARRSRVRRRGIPGGLLPRPRGGLLIRRGALVDGGRPPGEIQVPAHPGRSCDAEPRLRELGVRLERARDRGGDRGGVRTRVRRTLVAKTRIFSPPPLFFRRFFRFLVDLDASASGGSGGERAQLYRDGARSRRPRVERRPRPRREHPDPRARRSRSRRRHRGGVLLRGGVPAPRRRDARGKGEVPGRVRASARVDGADEQALETRRRRVRLGVGGSSGGGPRRPVGVGVGVGVVSSVEERSEATLDASLRLVRGEASRVEADGVRGTARVVEGGSVEPHPAPAPAAIDEGLVVVHRDLVPDHAVRLARLHAARAVPARGRVLPVVLHDGRRRAAGRGRHRDASRGLDRTATRDLGTDRGDDREGGGGGRGRAGGRAGSRETRERSDVAAPTRAPSAGTVWRAVAVAREARRRRTHVMMSPSAPRRSGINDLTRITTTLLSLRRRCPI